MWIPGFLDRRTSSVKVLFILKNRESYCDNSSYPTCKRSGLYNSARFVAEMLSKFPDVDSKVVQVIDNNCIDREVTAYRPTHVVIEALWVVPEKFAILQQLHPNVHWIVRGHSEIPFLSNEGIAIDWLLEYVKFPNVSIATNSVASLRDLRIMVSRSHPTWGPDRVARKVVNLPNYYPVPKVRVKCKRPSDILDVGCFGAIRPLKNNLIQAIAAIQFANLTGRQLRFHINGTRSEQGGNNNLKNIRALFAHTEHELIEHPWLSHSEFLELLREMDISLNVSFTESFNIVAADSVASGVPLVTSPEVHWSSSLSHASPTSSESIVAAMYRVTQSFLGDLIKRRNLFRLKRYARNVRHDWLHWINTR